MVGFPQNAVPGAVDPAVIDRLILVFVILTVIFVTAAITMFLRYPLGEDDHNSRIATLAARENGLAAQSPSGLG
jgi:GPH family glycoside/pentoside/hexuronide:cation symporter